MFDGIRGWVAGKAMERMNAAAEHEAVERLAPCPGASVLVGGFGPGVGLAHLLTYPVEQVVGVDPSGAMYQLAAQRNRAAIDSGRLRLVSTVLADIDPALGPFDGMIAVHTFQMCSPFAPTAERLAQVLVPDARLVSITHGWAAARDHGSVEAFVTMVCEGLTKAGFAKVESGFAAAEGGKAILVEARR